MYDTNLIVELLNQILKSALVIKKRFSRITSVNQFLNTDKGLERLDSICMQLIAIGEGLKKIDALTNGSLLSKYPTVNWKGAKAIRDIISHHYFHMDAEVVFNVCSEDMEPMIQTLEQIIQDVKNN